ncbi:hypothetical protein X733_19550 [Mesorhizobium sp. L2C067A000]|nr:hypothetical protein X767_09400 [Mesorhizobium sp. LSJC264A00]ESX85828.1 hypothetical protein X756_21210 [Mesorhizobium sp. LSHC412B00]ESZ31704.1 hypothetical protein X733_19550 [Mesorhizobium sp. L2C067A000]
MKHIGRSATGQVKGAPVCVKLAIYPLRIEAGKVMIQI